VDSGLQCEELALLRSVGEYSQAHAKVSAWFCHYPFIICALMGKQANSCSPAVCGSFQQMFDAKLATVPLKASYRFLRTVSLLVRIWALLGK